MSSFFQMPACPLIIIVGCWARKPNYFQFINIIFFTTNLTFLKCLIIHRYWMHRVVAVTNRCPFWPGRSRAPYLAWASSRLWSVMVIICCKMSPMSCFLPSPSVPPVPSMCWDRPGCPAIPTPAWECINRGCSSISYDLFVLTSVSISQKRILNNFWRTFYLAYTGLGFHVVVRFPALLSSKTQSRRGRETSPLSPSLCSPSWSELNVKSDMKYSL